MSAKREQELSEVISDEFATFVLWRVAGEGARVPGK
jgi:hypothetical protein